MHPVELGQAGWTTNGSSIANLGQAYIWWTVELGQARKTKKVSIIAKVGQADIGFIL